ncbi:MAG TPA: hypothetical protein VLH36_04525, partial [Steroidobacteraceae bacterium]|nr:hypothetical protein [Steroidobacteraceae bacterium]
MAIQYLRNALGPTTSTTSVSVTLPATAAGDLLIFEYVHRGTGTGTIGGTSVSTGGLTWNNKHDQLFGASAFSGHTYWTIATGDHSGQTVTASSLTNSSAGIVTVYSGAHQTTPLDDATVVGEQNASADEGQAAITTATNGAWVVLVVVNSPDLAVSSQAAANLTLTERAERLSTGGTDASIAHASGVLATAGSSGAFTWAQTNAASGSWAYAIKPAPMVGSGSGTIAATGAGTGTSVSVYQGNAWMPGAWASGAWASGAWATTEGTHSGSGTGTIAASTGSGTGTKARSGTGAGTIAASTGSGSGFRAGQVAGSGAGTIAALTGTGTGLKARSGLGAGTLAAATGTGTGLKARSGSGAGVIAAATGSGSGTTSIDTWLLASFDTPVANPTPGTGLQEFRVLVRKNDTANPTVDVSLYEDGALVATLVSGTSVTSATGQIVTATWDAALLADPTGADVE